jgi:hypothetical protein
MKFDIIECGETLSNYLTIHSDRTILTTIIHKFLRSSPTTLNTYGSEKYVKQILKKNTHPASGIYPINITRFKIVKQKIHINIFS